MLVALPHTHFYFIFPSLSHSFHTHTYTAHTLFAPNSKAQVHTVALLLTKDPFEVRRDVVYHY